MTRIRGGQMVFSISHNNTVHLIKMTLSRRGKHILWVQIQNSKAAVTERLVFCALNALCLFTALMHMGHTFSMFASTHTILNLLNLLKCFWHRM